MSANSRSVNITWRSTPSLKLGSREMVRADGTSHIHNRYGFRIGRRNYFHLHPPHMVWRQTTSGGGKKIHNKHPFPAKKIKNFRAPPFFRLGARGPAPTQTSVPYIIVQNYPPRFAGVPPAINVGNLFAALGSRGPLFNVPATATVP